MSMSPTGDFLTTAHVNYLGLFLWANKTLFSHVSLRAIDPTTEAPLLELPTSMHNKDDNGDDIKLEDLDDGELLNQDYQSPIQLASELVTMSTLAAARWQNLLTIELVKKRNRPKAPPKTPKQAPFFLPTVAGLDLKFDLSRVANQNGGSASKLLVPDNFHNLTAFGKLLDDTRRTENYEKCIAHLTALGPSMIDFEIKSLNPDGGGGTVDVMLQFMKVIGHMLRTNLNFELAQSYLAVFLKANGPTIVEYPMLKGYLTEIENAQAHGWKALEEKLLFGLGVVSTLRNFSI